MLNLSFDRLEGGQLTAATGKVTLVVNTASECGLTPQYAELQQLWDKFRERGLVVLGLPCNDFGKQEPGAPGDIQSFCQMRYGVTFPLTGKVAILDKQQRHPFYASVVAAVGEEQLPRWNFHKYLVGREGELLAVFPSKVSPLATEVVAAIEEALA